MAGPRINVRGVGCLYIATGPLAFASRAFASLRSHSFLVALPCSSGTMFHFSCCCRRPFCLAFAVSARRSSSVLRRELDDLVAAGLLCPRTGADEWLEPWNEAVPASPPGYVVSFIPFHERGVGEPMHDFFRALLHHYGAELQHLNPNGVQQIEPHFDLWCHFFLAQLQRFGRSVPLRTSSHHCRPPMKGCTRGGCTSGMTSTTRSRRTPGT